jgi:hypothetical protein
VGGSALKLKDENGGETLVPILVCRKGPPTATGLDGSAFPPVGANTWCYDWRPGLWRWLQQLRKTQ